MSPHGTNSRYQQGCPCDPCRDAHRAYSLRNAQSMRQRAREDPALIPHGTTGGYRNWGCRCGDCSAVVSAADADYRRRVQARQSP